MKSKRLIQVSSFKGYPRINSTFSTELKKIGLKEGDYVGIRVTDDNIIVLKKEVESETPEQTNELITNELIEYKIKRIIDVYGTGCEKNDLGIKKTITREKLLEEMKKYKIKNPLMVLSQLTKKKSLVGIKPSIFGI